MVSQKRTAKLFVRRVNQDTPLPEGADSMGRLRIRQRIPCNSDILSKLLVQEAR